MVYRFLVKSEEAPGFKLEIAIDSEDTFFRLRNAIVEAAGYGKDQVHSFYICDDEWRKQQEVTLIDMDTDTDEDIWLMEDTHLYELLDDEGQKMKFVYDILNERFFYISLKEIIPGKEMRDPLCQKREGRAPKEIADMEAFDAPAAKVPTPAIDDLDEDFYGANEFNEDEIDDFAEIDSENLQ